MEGKFVVFKMGEEKFGVPIEAVERILPATHLTKIPRSPKALVGMFPFQGSTVAVIDAATRFELPEPDIAHHFLVVTTDLGRYGIRVENVETIVEYLDADVDPAQSWLSSVEPDMAYGVGKKEDKLCLLLKPEAIVPGDLRKKLDKLVAVA